MHLEAFPREMRFQAAPVPVRDTTGAGPASALRLGTSPGLSDERLRQLQDRNNSEPEKNKSNYQRGGLRDRCSGSARPAALPTDRAPRERAPAQAGGARTDCVLLGARKDGRVGGWRPWVYRGGEREHRKGKTNKQ